MRTTKGSQNVKKNDLLGEVEHLRRFAVSLTGNDDEANDLMQDVFVLALQNIESKKPQVNLRSWLFVIARNLFIDSVRRDRKAPDRGHGVAKDDHGEPPATERLTPLLLDLTSALAKLDKELQDVVWSAAILKEGYAETASRTRVAIGTVRSRLFRARSELRDHMSDYLNS